jgi:circadian clock protein KaiA
VSPILQVCCLLPKASHQEIITQFLAGDRFNVTNFYSIEQLSKNLIEEQANQDCLVIWLEEEFTCSKLPDLDICLPTVIIFSPLCPPPYAESLEPSAEGLETSPEFIYPTAATVNLDIENLVELPEAIEKAIALFLKLPTKIPPQISNIPEHQFRFNSLALAQQRLAEKLRERLGYLGVYYKRDIKQFWRRLSTSDQADYTQRLQDIYRSVILEYFKDQPKELNTLIDEFASMCFFADISVSQVLQIHMDLMEDFANQLRLEGRNEDVLLDYRITLIDAIAHLCEMYRRSIPRDIPKEVQK